MVAKIKAGESSAVGSEAERESSGWQGKLNSKRHKCNEARKYADKCVLPEEESFIASKAAT